VILIDEYDKPILSNLHSSQLPQIKQVMNTFYAIIKSLDEHLHFIFITGVSKFAKVSVFSSMNSLTDISMDKRYTTLCGISEAELTHNFAPAIEQLALAEHLAPAAALDKIKYWYNGYHFHHNGVGVYNPYSVLSLFNFQEFDNYWFATGTPTFLIDLIKTQKFDLNAITDLEVDKSAFMAIEPEQIGPLIALLQTGYLSISAYDDGWYQLDFPNYEVKYSFNRAIIEQFTHTEPGINIGYIRKLTKALNQGDIDSFLTILQIFFANIPNNITLKDEKYYQSIFYAVITLIGFDITAEVNTNQGRIDCVMQTDDTIYIIEFKINDSCEAALQQIINKKYAQKYQGGDKAIILLGVEFDQKTRNIGEYVQQTL
jgi:hypothetical protein